MRRCTLPTCRRMMREAEALKDAKGRAWHQRCAALTLAEVSGQRGQPPKEKGQAPKEARQQELLTDEHLRKSTSRPSNEAPMHAGEKAQRSPRKQARKRDVAE